MKHCKLTPQTRLCVVLFVTLLTACEKDVYQPVIPEKPKVEIDWSTQKSTQLNVGVNDAYAGKYYYTVGAYLLNPATDPEARMIAGSGQKTNSKVAYSRDLVLPDLTETIYIAVTDPFKRCRIYAADVEGETISFREGEAVTKGTSVETRAVSVPSVSYDYGSTYVELSGSGYTVLKKETTYVIKAGKTFSGPMGFPGEGTFRLFVEGTLEWNGSAMTLGKDVELYVCKGGVVKNMSEVRSLVLNGNAQIAVQAGASFGTDDAGAGFNLTLTNESKIINEGAFTGKSVTMNSKSTLYNMGTFSCEKLGTDNATNAIVNTHHLKAASIRLNNATIHNECMLSVGTFTVVSNATVNLASGAYVEAGELTAAGLTLNMGQQSLWQGEKASFSGQASSIRGEGANYALFNVDNVVISGWNIVTYSGKVEVASKNHTQPASQWDKKYTLTAPACFAVGQPSADIPGSDCNNQEGNDNPGDGNGDSDGSYEEDTTMPYTYLFEDNWPHKGDYDMNDVVISVEIRNITEQSKTKGVRIIANLLAAGATKKLGAGFQLDGIAAGKVSGSEAGQDYAVVPLFADAHAELGAPAGQPANTFSLNYTAKRIEKEIMFNTPIDGVVNSNNFNLFIVVDGGFNGQKRNEVHLPGFLGTKLAQVNENSTTKYVDVETGWMWAMAIPQVEFTTYPRENVPVNTAYEGFTEWVAGSGVPGWYMHPVEDKVIRYK